MTDDGLILSSPLRHQEHCQISYSNMCKADVLWEYIRALETEGSEVVTVGYAGDGANDLCPMMSLRAGDLIFPRADKPIIRLLEENEGGVKAGKHVWTSGEEILAVWRDHVRSKIS